MAAGDESVGRPSSEFGIFLDKSCGPSMSPVSSTGVCACDNGFAGEDEAELLLCMCSRSDRHCPFASPDIRIVCLLLFLPPSAR